MLRWLRIPLVIFLALGCGAAVFAQPAVTNEIDAAAGAAVIQLLESGDASHFALQMVATTNDLAEQGLSNTVTHEVRLWPFTPKSVEAERQKVADSARLFLRLASRLGMDSSRMTFRVKQVEVIEPPADAAPPEEVQFLPYKPELKITLRGESSDARMAGDYTVVLIGATRFCSEWRVSAGATKFCSGWRISQGIRWGHVPPGLAAVHRGD